jgi:DNA-binding transcriptional MerR regulator
MNTPKIFPESSEGPQSALERKYIQEYLQGKGVSLEQFRELPKEERKQLMRAASRYASLKLAEVESRAKFRHDIHTPS